MQDNQDKQKSEDIVQATQVQEEQEFINKDDMNTLAMIKLNIEKLTAESKLALSKCEFEDLRYKHTIAQLYLKYGLSPTDKVNEDGRVVRAKKDNK